MSIRLKSAKDIAGLRESGAILADVLRELTAAAAEGMRLEEFDRMTRAALKRRKATPTFLNYRPEGANHPYPAALCTSVNNQVVHGLPNTYQLQKGDLLKIDLGVTYKGYITDSATTVGVGKVSPKARRLITATERALEAGIAACVPGGHLGDIGHAAERTARRAGCRVIRGLTGHGVGFKLHEDPPVPNSGKKGIGMSLPVGLVIAIEPMLAAGSGEIIQREDGSYATADGSLSAHFEHTVAILDDGAEILTL